VVVSGANRKFVLVDGNAVHPGETYRGAKLLSIAPNGPVWQRGGARETDTMSPNVEKSKTKNAGEVR
jgi:hypothetical protein